MASVNVSVVGSIGGSVNVYQNNGYIGTVTSSVVFSNFVIGDSITCDAISASGYSFQKFCEDSSCTVSTTTNPFTTQITQEIGFVYTHFIQLQTMDVTAITVTQDNVNLPYTRTVTVTGTGTGSYLVYEGNTAITSRTLSNGFDQFTLDSISGGTHTYCVTPSSNNACTTFTVVSSTTTYKCINNACTQSLCTIGTLGCYTNNTCNNACTTTLPSGTCVECDLTKNFCLSSIGLGCQPQIYVYGAATAFVLIMTLQK